MFRNLVTKFKRVPPGIRAILLIAGIVVVALLLSGCATQTEADKAGQAPDVMPLAARVDRLDGDVGIARQPDNPDTNQNSGQNVNPNVSQAQPNTDWAKASVNSPVSVGSRVYVKDRSHAAIAFSGRNYARLNSNTSLDVLSLSQRRTQLALRDGSGVFDVGALASGELFEVATPGGAVDFMKPGLYQVGIGDDGRTLVSVLAGSAQVVGLGGGGEIGQGRCLTFGTTGAEDVQEDAYVADLDPAVSGGIVHDYYSYRYPKTYDGRYRDYNTYLNDPYYYDPYRRSVSHQYIPDDAEVAGLDDLNDNGDWEDIPGHGHCWRPRVATGWAPYRDGSWYDDQPLGLTWVSNESWGWAPYHYGRWANVNHGWYWEPGETTTRPIYAPALVAFVPFPREDRIGWVPLGPGDPYVPRYYDRNYQPQYIGSTTYVTQNVNVINIVNYNVPGAVTVVASSGFTRVIAPNNPYADPALLAQTRPVVDAYGVPRIREMAPGIQAVRPVIQVPVEARQALGRSVITSQTPVVPVVATGSVNGLNVQVVPQGQTKRQLRIANSAQSVTAIKPNGLPAVTPQAGQNQSLTPQQQQKAERRAEAQQQGQQPAQQQPDSLEQLKQQQKAERKATAQQQGQQPQQQPDAQQQLKQRQKAERKAAAQQQGQQPAQQQPDTLQQLKQQQKAERKAAAQQQGQQPAQQQADAQQQQKQQQQKAQRKAAAQQQGQQPAQQQPDAQQQLKQQQKAERKAAQQQQQQQTEQGAPSKAERKAEKAKNKNKNSNSGQ